MATMFVPTIAPADYQAFRRVVDRDLPDTYDEWLNLAGKMTLDNAGKGHLSEPLDVNPDEFARYIRATGDKPNLHGFDNFTQQKGAGHSY